MRRRCRRRCATPSPPAPVGSTPRAVPCSTPPRSCPGRAERWLLTAIAGGDEAAVGRGLDTCVERGLLVPVAPGVVAFRHELARVAILDELTVAGVASGTAAHSPRCASTAGTDVVRLAHHAVEADDGAAVVELAPAAARAAAAAGAHRAAAVQLVAVLAYADRLSASEQATVLFDLGRELMLVGSGAEAVVAFDRCAELAALAGDLDREVAARLEGVSRVELARPARRVAGAAQRRRRARRGSTRRAVQALVELAWCVGPDVGPPARGRRRTWPGRDRAGP